MGGEDERRALGAAGERFAAAHLVARGFTLIDRNFRTRYGELDLVAANERYLVFCEVKALVARGAPQPLDPLASVDWRKRRRLRGMAREWLSTRAADRPRPPELRFDAIGVTLDRAGGLVALEHVEDAF
ncbi:MAG TPA: YraN family protein [Thermoleophilaceae bacterium]|nr:YraN family protein [Thermoleophilaceae bacterium]